jgi:hypothetical protein
LGAEADKADPFRRHYPDQVLGSATEWSPSQPDTSSSPWTVPTVAPVGRFGGANSTQIGRLAAQIGRFLRADQASPAGSGGFCADVRAHDRHLRGRGRDLRGCETGSVKTRNLIIAAVITGALILGAFIIQFATDPRFLGG